MTWQVTEDGPSPGVGAGTDHAGLVLDEHLGHFRLVVYLGGTPLLAHVWLSAPPEGGDEVLVGWVKGMQYACRLRADLDALDDLSFAACQQLDVDPASPLHGVAAMVSALAAQKQEIDRLRHVLEAIRLTDRSAVYDPGEARPDGTRPASPTRPWLTPRQLVAIALEDADDTAGRAA